MKGLHKCHDLPFTVKQVNDYVLMIYDIANPRSKRKQNIPNVIQWHKNDSVDYVNCIQQNGRNYGFLLLNDVMVYMGEEVVWTHIPSVIEAHTIIKHSAVPNFMGARIPVHSQFNIPAWKSYLIEYWNKQTIDLFPLDFDRSRTLESTQDNHTSVLKCPDHVQHYIDTGIKYGAILGPFDQYPFPCHQSPFLTKKKQILVIYMFSGFKFSNRPISK